MKPVILYATSISALSYIYPPSFHLEEESSGTFHLKKQPDAETSIFILSLRTISVCEWRWVEFLRPTLMREHVLLATAIYGTGGIGTGNIRANSYA